MNTVNVEDSTTWDEFNMETIQRLFRPELAQTYRGLLPVTPDDEDRILFDEDTVEDLIRGYIVPPVNAALKAQSRRPYLGRGSRVKIDSKKPDWAVIRRADPPQSRYQMARVTGDTKVSKKFDNDMKTTKKNAWQSVMTQVATYMHLAQTRYGFVLTDNALLVLRLRSGRNIAEAWPKAVSAACCQRWLMASLAAQNPEEAAADPTKATSQIQRRNTCLRRLPKSSGKLATGTKI